MIEVFKGSTNRSEYFVLVDSTTGLPKSGVAYTAVVGSYLRTRGVRTAITMLALGSANASYSSGGWFEIDATNQTGLYRIDVPNAAFATGVDQVILSIVATSCKVEHKGYVLTDWNNQSSIPTLVWDELLTTATHNIQNSAGRILRQANPTATNDAIWSGTAQTGSTTTTIKLDTGASSVDQNYLYNIVSIVGGTGAGQSRVITQYVGSTRVATVDRAWVVTPDNTSTFEITESASARVISYSSGQDPATLVWAATVRTLTSLSGVTPVVSASGTVNNTPDTATSSIFRGDNSLSSTDDFYNGCILAFVQGAGLFPLARRVTDYTGSTRTFTFAQAFPSAPIEGAAFILLGHID